MGLLRMMRPGNCVMAFVGVFIGAIVEIYSGIHFSWLYNSSYWGFMSFVFPDFFKAVTLIFPVTLAAIAAMLVTGAGNVLNDYYDRKLDKKAHPERPIPSGEVEPGQALNFANALFASGIILTILVNWLCVIIALLNAFLLITYERKLKAEGLSGNFAISYLTASVFLFGGAAVLSFSYVLILFLLALLANVSREITKDIEDMTADKAYRQTLPLTAGKKRATEIAQAYLLWAVILSFLPILFMIIQTLNSSILTEPSWSSIISRTLIYTFGVILADAVFINSYYTIKVNPKMAQERMKLGMLIAMLAFFLFGLFGLIIRQGYD